MKIVYIDLDDTLFEFTKARNEDLIKCPNVRFPQSQVGFFSNLEPIENSIETVKELSKYFDIYFLTSPSVFNLTCYTEKALSIKKHFGHEWLKKLIISYHKELLIGDYLIDDRTSGRGQESFNGELINYGSDKFPNWRTIKKYLYNINYRSEQ